MAVDGVDLDIPPGEVFGLIGPNGAGKSTLIALLCTLVTPTSGEGRVAGFDLVGQRREVRGSLGINFGGERGFYWRLSLAQNLDFFAAVNGLGGKAKEHRVQERLELVGLWESRHTRFGEASAGMKRRLNFARAILFDRPIYLCDEPTTGIDPESAQRIQKILGELRTRGHTIVLVTHNLPEIDQLADRVAMMVAGRLRFVGTPAALRRLIVPSEIAIALAAHATDRDREQLRSAVVHLDGFRRLSLTADRLIAACDDPEGSLPQVLAALGADGLPVEGAWVVRPSLQDVFIRLVEEA